MPYSNSWKNETPATALAIVTAPNAHDVLIAYAVQDSSGGSFTWPAGFAQVANQSTTFDGQTLGVAIKNDASGAEGTLTINAGGNIVGGIIAMSGRDNVNTQDFAASVTNNNTGTASPWTLASNSVTAGHDGCDFVAIMGHDSDGGNLITTTFATTAGDVTVTWITRQEVTDGDFRNAGIGTGAQSAAAALTVTGTGTAALKTAGRALVVIGLRSSGGAPPAATVAPGLLFHIFP